MMPKEKAASPGRGEAAQHSTISPHRNDPTWTMQGRHLPAYGRDLVTMQRRGFNVPWLLISLGWHTGKALPRVVVADDVDAASIDLTLVRGLDCMVAHHGDTHRAFDVAELALMYGAKCCPVFDMETGKTTTTAEMLLARRAAA